MLASPTATEEDLANIRGRLGLDQPLPVQYGRWVAALLRVIWARRCAAARRCMEILPERYWNTIRLTVASMVVAVIVGFAGGDGGGGAARFRGRSAHDRVSPWRALDSAVLARSDPDPGLLGPARLAARRGRRLLAPPDPAGDLAGAATAALIARMVRSSLLEVIRTDYCARAAPRVCANGRCCAVTPCPMR